MEFSYPWEFSSRRSAPMAMNGMVAASQPLAARVGTRVLEDGGTVVDAAVAAAGVLNVVEPHMTGVGGDVFALLHLDGEYTAYNGSGGAPAKATLEEIRSRTDAESTDGEPVMPDAGGLTVTVPGAVEAWDRLLDAHGEYDLSEALEPAIGYARDGFPVTERVSQEWADHADRLRPFDESVETYLPGAEAPAPGQVFRNPALADTLEVIAREGPEAVYEGVIGRAIVDIVQAHDGVLGMRDLEAHTGEWTDPIATDYNGVEVLEHPPNGQGLVALEALNIAGHYDLPPDPTDPHRLHYLIEATKAAFADGYAAISDPAAVDVPVERLLSPEHAAEWADMIGHRARAYSPRLPGVGHDTIYLAVADGDGNAISFINSIYMAFGSGLTTRGFALQNRGHSFSLRPGHANAIDPGKRPFHTIIPAMLREDGAFRAAWGVMGGAMQPQGHLQVVCNLVDSGLNPQAAIDAPRFRWLDGNRVALETTRIPEAVQATLRARGHRIVEEPSVYASGGHFGGAQFVYHAPNGGLIGASDPRKDGQAIGY